MNPVIMHINYGEISFDSFGSNTIDDICRMAAELGFDGIEFRGAPPKEFKEMPFDDFMDMIAQGVKKYGIRMPIFSIGLPNSASADKQTRIEAADAALKKVQKIHDMFGTTVFNTCGTTILSKDPAAPGTARDSAPIVGVPPKEPRDVPMHRSAISASSRSGAMPLSAP